MTTARKLADGQRAGLARRMREVAMQRGQHAVFADAYAELSLWKSWLPAIISVIEDVDDLSPEELVLLQKLRDQRMRL